MQTLFLFTLVLTGWRLASLADEPVGVVAAPQTPAVAAVAKAPAPPAATIPYRLVDGIDYDKPKPKPKVRGVPAPQQTPQTRTQPPPAPAQPAYPAYPAYPAPVPVYVYLVPVPAPATQTGTMTDYAVEDAYYNPVFKGADQIHYRPWPEYILYGRFWPAYISFPYPDPPRGRCFYRYLPAYPQKLNMSRMPLITPRAKCHNP